jgi:hypothetical protein
MDYKLLILLLIILVIVFIYYNNIKENFLSGGTIQQLFGKDSQDLYMNGDEIKPLIDGNFLLQYNQPTLMQNRIPRNQVLNTTNTAENNYPFGTDFYDNGDTGKIFFNKDFGINNDNNNNNNNNNKETIFHNQYTGEYYEPPLIDIAKPLNIY